MLCDSDPNSSYQKLQKLYMNKLKNFGIIKVYVRKLFKLKNDGKKEYETNPNPL